VKKKCKKKTEKKKTQLNSDKPLVQLLLLSFTHMRLGLNLRFKLLEQCVDILIPCDHLAINF